MLDSGTKHTENRIHLFDPVGLITDNYGGGYKSSSNVSVRPKRPTKSYSNFEEVNSNEELTDVIKNTDDINDGLELRFEIDKTKELEDASDVSTPRLWKKTLNSPAIPMSPNSRTRAIAKGRKELMEMVKDLPESLYELSLKDIVDHKEESEIEKGGIVVPEENRTGNTKKAKKSVKRVKKSDGKKMVRSKSVDNGRFLLRTSVFPIFCGLRKNKKGLGGSNSFKMSKQKTGSSGSEMKGGGEKDWWRRKSCISSESDDSNGLSSKSLSSGSSSSSRSRSRSSSNNGRRSKRFLPICCLFNGKRITAKK